MKVGQE